MVRHPNLARLLSGLGRSAFGLTMRAYRAGLIGRRGALIGTQVGVSQAVPLAAAEARTASLSGFVNRLKSEADPEQPVLLADGPRAGKPKALA